MIDLSLAKTLANNYLEDICDLLKIDSGTIRLLFVPETNHGLPMIILEDDDTIIVSENFLQSLCGLGFTPLRISIYQEVRLIYLRRKGKLVFDINSLYAAFAACIYAQTAAQLKGLSTTLPHPESESTKSYLQAMGKCLLNDFGLHGRMYKLPEPPLNNLYFYKMKLSDEDANKFDKNLRVRASSCVKRPKGKGTLADPFENINEAVYFIHIMEQKAYTRDKLLQQITNQKYFYDSISKQFRIHWASPYVSIYKNKYPHNSFIVNQMESGFFSFKPNLYGKKFLYRGQNDYYKGKPCVPNMFRDAKHNEQHYYLDFLIFSQEMQLLLKSHPLIRLLEKGIVLLHDIFRIRMHYTGLAQHYYNKSTFLDLTSDMDVAKFFAATDYNRKEDRYYPFHGSDKIGVIYCYELQYPLAFQQHNGYALKTIGKQIPLRSGSQCGFLLEMEKDVDFKTLPEVTPIYFKHNNDIADEIFQNSREGQLYFGDHKELQFGLDFLEHAWRTQLKDRFRQRVVSMKTVEYNVSLNHGETIDSICKKLSDRKIHVDNYIPSFTEEELEMYYSAIQNGWWKDFCDDIHFYGPEDELYREELRNIPNRDEYKWAFFKNN